MSMGPTVGTRAWAMKTDGALADRDRRRLLAQAMLSRLAALPERWRRSLGLGEPALARVDPDALRLPDSAAALQATELLRASSAPWLANHCFRTYLWGAILARAGAIVFDEELLFVASALQDLGLTETGDRVAHCAACFAVRSARAAEQFAEQAGWPGERRARLSEAISLHLNVRVSLRHGAEAHLLHEGAALDVIGARWHELRQEEMGAVLGRYPRLGLKEKFSAQMKEQRRATPESRAAFLVGLGFNRLVRAAPWTD